MTCDRHVKTPRLIELGVGEVWLVDEAKHTIEIHTRNGHRVIRARDEARSAIVGGFVLVPAVLFEAAW